MKSKLLFFCIAGAIWLGGQTNVLASTDLPKVEEFVRQIFLHGVPYVEANRYDSTAVPTLTDMLVDPDEKPHWSNIVVTLGIIGDQEGVQDALTAILTFVNLGFLNLEERQPSLPDFRAKTSGLMAVGYWINKSKNEQLNTQIIQELSDVIDKSNLVGKSSNEKPDDYSNEKPDNNSNERVSESSGNPDQPGEAEMIRNTPIRPLTEIFSGLKDKDDEFKRQFGRTAIIGLALSGNPEAMKELRSFFDKAEADLPLRALIREAIEANITIADVGLVCYYNEESSECEKT